MHLTGACTGSSDWNIGRLFILIWSAVHFREAALADELMTQRGHGWDGALLPSRPRRMASPSAGGRNVPWGVLRGAAHSDNVRCRARGLLGRLFRAANASSRSASDDETTNDVAVAASTGPTQVSASSRTTPPVGRPQGDPPRASIAARVRTSRRWPSGRRHRRLHATWLHLAVGDHFPPGPPGRKATRTEGRRRCPPPSKPWNGGAADTHRPGASAPGRPTKRRAGQARPARPDEQRGTPP